MSVNTVGRTADFRGWYINGPTMVYVKGGEHMSGRPIARRSELGLSVDPIQVNLQFRHRDIRVDDFGGEIPADVMNQLSDAEIKMTLINFDPYVLNICFAESTGMYPPILRDRDSADYYAGTLGPAGRTIGRGLPLLASGCQYISLNINVNQYVDLSRPPLAARIRPWRFRSCYLSEQPQVYPLGTEMSAVDLTWRAIPYGPMFQSGSSLGEGTLGNIGILYREIVYTPKEIQSSGAVLWDRTLDPVGHVLTAEEAANILG